MDSPVPVRPAGNGPEGETGTTVRYQKTGGFLKPEGALIPPPKDAVQHRMGVEVHKIVKPKELRDLFLPYHTMDPAQAIDRILEAKGLANANDYEEKRQFEIYKRIRKTNK